MPRAQHQAGQLVRIDARVPWITHFNATTGEWLAACLPLNLNAAGETFQEMQAVANEAMTLLFEDLVETGEFDAFLRRNGWRADTVVRPGPARRFDVPTAWRDAELHQLMGA